MPLRLKEKRGYNRYGYIAYICTGKRRGKFIFVNGDVDSFCHRTLEDVRKGG